jgi:anti-sigma B factor antagonist
MEIKNYPQAVVIELIERVDSTTSREVESKLLELINGGAKNLICDCTPTRYISSAGLRVILSAAKTLKKNNGQLVLCCPQTGYAYEVLETAGFTHIIPVVESEAEALKKVGAQA